MKFTGRGVGKKTAGKIRLVSKLFELGLDIRDCALHPGCSSAKYFINQLSHVSSRANLK
ncbi:MAG: hypothetical protein JWQ40_2408 [Segetibacter sp.]|nr:hypothetical protein [Segetibacter sp.]